MLPALGTLYGPSGARALGIYRRSFRAAQDALSVNESLSSLTRAVRGIWKAHREQEAALAACDAQAKGGIDALPDGETMGGYFLKKWQLEVRVCHSYLGPGIPQPPAL